MSTAAKLTLGGTILGTIGIVILVHRQQKVDQAVRRDYIIMKRRERFADEDSSLCMPA